MTEPEQSEAIADRLSGAPEHWTRTGLRRFTTVSAGDGFPLERQGKTDEEIPFYKVNALSRADPDGVIRFRDETISRESAHALRAKIFPAGTVVMAKIGAALLLGRICVLEVDSCLDNNLLGVLPARSLDMGYLRYSLLALDFRMLVNPGAVPSLSDAAVLDAALAWPPLSEQRAVADFLDRETGEIDAFIRDQEELIGLLQERRDSSWQAAVEGAARVSAEMPLRRVIDSIVDGPFGSSLTSSHYSTEGARVIRLGNIGINRFKSDDKAYIPLDYFRGLMAHSVQPGDVIVAGLGDEQMPLGRAAVVPDLGPALVKADCFRVRPSRTVSSEFLAWILSAPQTRARMRLLARGSTRQRLNTAVVRDVQIPVPSLMVQEQTLSNWRKELGEIDGALQDAFTAKALSHERRSALISAAVTGKIDVRERVGV